MVRLEPCSSRGIRPRPRHFLDTTRDLFIDEELYDEFADLVNLRVYLAGSPKFSVARAIIVYACIFLLVTICSCVDASARLNAYNPNVTFIPLPSFIHGVGVYLKPSAYRRDTCRVEQDYTTMPISSPVRRVCEDDAPLQSFSRSNLRCDEVEPYYLYARSGQVECFEERASNWTLTTHRMECKLEQTYSTTFENVTVTIPSGMRRILTVTTSGLRRRIPPEVSCDYTLRDDGREIGEIFINVRGTTAALLRDWLSLVAVLSAFFELLVFLWLPILIYARE